MISSPPSSPSSASSSQSSLLPLDASSSSSSLPPPGAATSGNSFSSFDPAIHLHSGEDDDCAEYATKPGSATRASRKDTKAGGGRTVGESVGRHRLNNNSAGANTVSKDSSSCNSGSQTHRVPSSQSADDDLEALRLQSAEVTAAKSRQGIVIQHRAWPPEHAFRSEEDYDGVVDSPLRKRRKLSSVEAGNENDIVASFPESFTDATEVVGALPDIVELDGRVLPSSPPSLVDMASLTSSSTADLRSSSPTVVATAAVNATITAPLPSQSSRPRVVAGFVVDDDDDYNNDDSHAAALDFSVPAGEKDGHVADIFGGKLKGIPALSQPYSFTQASPLPDFIHPPTIAEGGRESLPEAYDSHSFASSDFSSGPKRSYEIQTCSGNRYQSRPKPPSSRVPFEQLIASRSAAAQAGRAQKAYYGIEIHKLIDEASKESERQSAAAAAAAAAAVAAASASPPPIQSIEHSGSGSRHRSLMPTASRTLLWTEKYRATRYTDLVGDERTHRSVLGWLKNWDPIVFPATARQKKQQQQQQQQRQQQQPAMALGPFASRGGEARAVHRKVLLLAGPPGLGKTTLAHVCARHAGYEVVEINASDERSRDVVKGRIRECVGSQNVRAATSSSSASATAFKRPVSTVNRKAAAAATTTTTTDAGRPVCVIVDEVDGAYGGSGSSGDGGFISALMELLALDQKNAAGQQQQQQPRTAPGALAGSRKKKGGRRGDNFRLSRPIILVCNDAYHPSLRPLRQSALAEIVHARRPLLSQVAARVQAIFRQEGYACDGDGVRKLCEAAWGCASSQRNAPGSLASFFAGHAEGDLRGVLVVAEWVAGKLRAAAASSSSSSLSSSLSLSSSGASAACARLTRHWVERHVLGELAHGGGAARGLGRGGAKEAVERVFLEGAGYQNSASSAHTGGAAAAAADVPAAGAAVGVAELRKRYAMRRLNELVESCGEVDRVMTDCFAIYPAYPYRDDTILTKPNQAYEWLHFHDCVASRLYGAQEWELAEYQCQPVLAFHDLFATPAARMAAWSSAPEYHTSKGGGGGGGGGGARAGAAGAGGAGGVGAAAAAAGYNGGGGGFGDDDGAASAAALPFSGPRAEFAAREAEKHCRAVLVALLAQLPPALARSFRSPEHVATELLPYLVRLVTPNVRPVIVGGSGEQRGLASVRTERERELVRRAVGVMNSVGLSFQRCRLENDATAGRAPVWVYRMEPPLDVLSTFETASAVLAAPTDDSSTSQPPRAAPNFTTRYAIRQVLEQECQKDALQRQHEARQKRWTQPSPPTTSSRPKNATATNADNDYDDDEEEAASTAADKGHSGSSGGSQKAVAGGVKRDFFGRVTVNDAASSGRPGDENGDGNEDGSGMNKRRKTTAAEARGRAGERRGGGGGGGGGAGKSDVWVSFHEGFSNAVRKPITLDELLRGL